MLNGFALAVASFFLSAFHPAPPATDTREPSKPCSLWTGTVSGNDPSVSISGNLCEDAKGNVTGSLTWTSARSGMNARRVAGAWASDHSALSMHDVAFTESRPKPGWMFCLVDAYTLAGSATGVTGTYHSEACHDDASVVLTRAR